MHVAGRDRPAYPDHGHPPFLERSWGSSYLPAVGQGFTLPGMATTAGNLGDAMPCSLRVDLLGGFAVAVDGIRIPAERWTSLRATHLLQLLSLQPRHRITRDLAVDALWPQLDPGAGAANLRKAVHNARQTLGRHDGIALQANELVLWPDRSVQVDAEVFQDRAAAALAQRDPAACAVVAMNYAGDLLPGARYEAWTESSRERLSATYVELLRVSGQWERLAQQEPTDEPAHRALMLH